MDKLMKFFVEGRLTQLLGENYNSISHALKELVDNAWDADAENVYITLPQTIDDDQVIIVRDDGIGMDEECITNEYMRIARNRRSEKGLLTISKQRAVKGKKGIGKFAGLLIANKMQVTTIQSNIQITFELVKTELVEEQNSLTSRNIKMTQIKDESLENGTIVELRDLDLATFLSLDVKLKQLLILEYGREDGFNIFINGTLLHVEDVGGKNYKYNDVRGYELNFNIADKKLLNKQSGIILRVDGKIVGEPKYWGVEDEDYIHINYLKKIYGEASADFLEKNTSTFWGIIEGSDEYQDFCNFIKESLLLAIKEKFKEEIKIAKKKLEKEIKEKIEKLPEYKKEKAQKVIDKLLTSLSNGRHSQEQIQNIISVTIAAIESDDYYEIIEKLAIASDEDIGIIAKALNEFGLVDMAQIMNQAKARLDFLNKLEVLVTNKNTLEKDVHTALAANMWVFGSSYSMMTSNKSTKTIIETFLNEKYEQTDKNNRPDLLLSKDYREHFLLVEFKRPSVILNRDHQAQAEKYRDRLLLKFTNKTIEIIILGKSIQAGMVKIPEDIKFLSYEALIFDARNQLQWLIENLTS